MTKKIALIFGITGQDGSYLAELLIEKEYNIRLKHDYKHIVDNIL